MRICTALLVVLLVPTATQAQKVRSYASGSASEVLDSQLAPAGLPFGVPVGSRKGAHLGQRMSARQQADATFSPAPDGPPDPRDAFERRVNTLNADNAR